MTERARPENLPGALLCGEKGFSDLRGGLKSAGSAKGGMAYA